MKFKDKTYIKSLMVLGSSVCNLNCSYCYLENQHKSNAYVLLNKKIQEAWIDGTYVNNIKNVFNTLECDPQRVTDLEIWGGEPLILTNNLIKPIREILEFFPNINYINIPTNFTRINHLYEFINEIECVKSEQNSKEKLNLHIQISVDAPEGEAQQYGHPVNWDVYINNIENLCSQLSKREQPFNHMMLGLEWHGTMSTNIILKHLNTYEDIKRHCDLFNKFHLDSINIIKKYKLDYFMFQESETSFPHNATPADSNIEEALGLEKSSYLTRYIERHVNYRLEKSSKVHIYTKNSCDTGSRFMFGPNPVCLESGVHAMTIMYDGSICECPCDYILNFDGYWDWITDNPLKRHEYREGMYKKQFYINPLTATQKDWDDFNWYVFDASRLNQSTSLHLMMNFYIEMAKSGQIDYIYFEDLEKLLKHLIQFNQSYSCPKDQLMYTYTAYMGGTGAARKFFNGIVDMAQDDYKQDMIFEAKGNYKWKM